MLKNPRFWGWWMALVLLLGPVARGAEAPAATGEPSAPAAAEPAEHAPADSKANEAKPADDHAPADEIDAPKAAPAAAAKSAPRDDGRRATEDYYELYKSLADALDQVERNYVQPIDRRELMEAAIRGMLEKLDPYSGYISPEEMSGFRSSVESQFGGVGLQITSENGQLKVSSPLVGTPAYRAGIQAGDRIVSIEGQPTRNLSLSDAVKRLQGKSGTSVSLTVQHSLTREIETVTLMREVIHLDTVMGDKRKPDDSWEFMLDPERHIGYIRVTAFSRGTAGELRKALEDLQARKLRGLIIDLRFNPGGLLTSAVEVCDLFISEGRIVSTKGRNTIERTWDAVKPGTFEGFPIAILVNHYSASASEIVAACLQDHERAVVIGDRSYGKGSVQNVVELESGKSALKLTTATYARPNGHKIHRFPDDKESDEWGVKPNEGMEVHLSNAEIVALMNNRRQRDIIRPDGHATTEIAKVTGDATGTTADGLPKEPGATKEASDAAPSESTAKEPPASDGGTKTDTAPAADAGQSAAESKPSDFVDRQLQKAIDYLTAEMARAQ